MTKSVDMTVKELKVSISKLEESLSVEPTVFLKGAKKENYVTVRNGLCLMYRAAHAPAAPVGTPCTRCNGSGQYLSYGECFRCSGNGVQSAADKRRNWGYDKHHVVAPNVAEAIAKVLAKQDVETEALAEAQLDASPVVYDDPPPF